MGAPQTCCIKKSVWRSQEGEGLEVTGGGESGAHRGRRDWRSREVVGLELMEGRGSGDHRRGSVWRSREGEGLEVMGGGGSGGQGREGLEVTGGCEWRTLLPGSVTA